MVKVYSVIDSDGQGNSSSSDSSAGESSSGSFRDNQVFDGVYLRPSFKGMSSGGEEESDWPEDWYKKMLVPFTVARVARSRGRSSRVYRDEWLQHNIPLDAVVWAGQPVASGKKISAVDVPNFRNQIRRIEDFWAQQRRAASDESGLQDAAADLWNQFQEDVEDTA